MNAHTFKTITDNAPVVTYGGTAASVVFWGLQVNEICAIISTVIAILGLGLQFYLAMHRIRRLEHAQGATVAVVSAIAGSQREVASKVENLEKGTSSGNAAD